jgi:hypothetical protein
VAIVGGLVAVAAIAVVPVLRSERRHTFAELTLAFRESQVGTIVLAPFDVFGRIVSAPALFPDVLPWTALAIAIIGSLVALVMWLDAQYLETADAAGQRIHARSAWSDASSGACRGCRASPGPAPSRGVSSSPPCDSRGESSRCCW